MINAFTLCLAMLTLHGPGGAGNLSRARIELACQQAPMILEAAKTYNINPYTLTAIIFVESRWSAKAVSRANACGLTQVIPKYVKYTCKELKDPSTSIKVGAKILDYWLTKRKKKNEKVALACYNVGNKCSSSARGRNYSRVVLKLAKKYKRWININTDEDDSGPYPKFDDAWIQQWLSYAYQDEPVGCSNRYHN